jgi:hypothetical protein
MSDSKGPETRAAALEERLRRGWARHTGLVAAHGGCWALAALVALILADLVLDWSLDLAGPVRLALVAGNVLVLSGIAWRVLVRRLRRYDVADEALQVERALPRMNGLVISSVQFRDEGALGPGVSRELARAVRRQAAQATAGLDLAKAWPAVPLRAAFAAGLLAVLGLGAVGAWKGPFLWVLACRMANPASARAYPTDTTIEVLSGDQVVRMGDPVTLQARAGGVIPAAGHVHVRFKGLDWEAAPVAEDGQAQFQHVLPRVAEDVEYYFRLGDAKSPRRRVTVVAPPRVVRGRLELRYPPYTGLKTQEVDTFNLKVPEGTQLGWRLRLDRPVASASCHLEGAAGAPMTLSADRREASLQLPAEASSAYRFLLHWQLGDRRYVETGARHFIQVIPDAEPVVSLLEPTEDAKGTLRKTITCHYWARDDYGLGEAAIVYAINDGGERRHPLGPLGGAAVAEKQLAWPITALLPGLKQYDIVTFAVEVTDARPGACGRGRSASRRVQFVSDQEYIAYVLGRQRKYLGQLRPLYLQEKEAARDLGALAPAMDAPSP